MPLAVRLRLSRGVFLPASRLKSPATVPPEIPTENGLTASRPLASASVRSRSDSTKPFSTTSRFTRSLILASTASSASSGSGSSVKTKRRPPSRAGAAAWSGGAKSWMFRVPAVKAPFTAGRAPPKATVALPAMSLEPTLTVSPVSL